MKIEAEVENPLCAVTSAEGRSGAGCSVGGGESPSTAQDSECSSIGRPDRQTTLPGCGGCGPGSAEHNNIAPLTSVFDCEHFQFIDDEDEGPGDEPTTQAPAGPDAAAPANGTTTSTNGVSDVDMSSDTEATAQANKGHAVRRQVSLDESSTKELRSVLKKRSSAKRQKGRVTFDESVTLYSDECENVQLLALTTGPDIVCTEVFCMFEPPIEYQDVPPFEPPAEYRDSDDQACQTNGTQEEEIRVQLMNGTADCCSAEVVVEADPETSAQSQAPELDRSDVAVSEEMGNNDSDSAVLEETPVPEAESAEASDESDKLFERFLEAEREFTVDDELNSVFQALENDFANDDKNGALDDSFFRKLINLLSSAEGSMPASGGGNPSAGSDSAGTEDEVTTEDDDSSQIHSRTLSEADSDCSISSQDTIIVRLGEDDNEQLPSVTETGTGDETLEVVSDTPEILSKQQPEIYDEVFSEASDGDIPCVEEKPKPMPRESLLAKTNHVPQAVARIENGNGESLSRQSSGEQSVNSANSQDPPQDADDSTSSDSRSGEVEEEMRLDDIGYDEEDADDYDEESFRGMAHGNSKIRRIIKKNALQCTLFRGIEAKRRQQPGAKYPRPKSPLLSQESLVEKLKWLTTIDEHKDADGPVNFHSKPPDVILSASGVPVNGSVSEADRGSLNYQQSPFYQMQQLHVLPPNGQPGYYSHHEGFPPTRHPTLPRPRVAYPPHPNQMMSNTLPYSQNRVVAHPATQLQWPDQQQQQQQQQQQRCSLSSMTVPRNFRDWRVIQRVTGHREGTSRNPQVPADYVRAGYTPGAGPPDVSRTSQPPAGCSKDELEQFVEQDSKRIERIKKRYSMAEEDDDPTFGFARRPSVRGVQNRIQNNPSDMANKAGAYALYEEPGEPHQRSTAAYGPDQMRMWSRDPSWRQDGVGQYGPPSQAGRSQVPMHIHRASVALTELPGNATIPYTHRKPPSDVRYHSYAESVYGSTRTLPTKGWAPPMLQVQMPAKDERGVPEGASSSPKISQDSLYHAPVPDSMAPPGTPHKDDGVIYYSLNV